MDLKAYFKKIREVEASIHEAFVVVASLDTSDGGKGGTFTEASRVLAARMIAEGRGRLASEEESAAFRESHIEARREAEALSAAQRMQVTLVHPSDSRTKPLRPSKD